MRACRRATRFNSVKSGSSRVVALDQSVASAAPVSRVDHRRARRRHAHHHRRARRAEPLLRAQLDLAQARYDYLLGRVKLASAAGSLTDDDVRTLNTYLR
jgi:outer membrane protein